MRQQCSRASSKAQQCLRTAVPLQKKLPIEVLLRWHKQAIEHKVRHPPQPKPDFFAGSVTLREFLGIGCNREWRTIMTTAGVPMKSRIGLTREECLRVMRVAYFRIGEKQLKKWELAERQVGTFRRR